MTKLCLDCDTVKDSSEFNKHSGTKTGLQVYCKECTRKRQKHYNNKYSTPERNRKYNIRRYGISIEEFDKLLDAQYECCAICEEALDLENLRNVHIDHCHNSTKVRGILCRSCNHLLGNARDRIGVLKAAIRYLEDSDPLITLR
jgi:hypothetical protein